MQTAQTTTGPLYSVRLTPYRSLGQSGIRAVAAVAALLALIPGVIFYVAGAWPVVGFLGLDVLALYWALSRSLADARTREDISLWRDRLLVSHFSPRGAERRHQFNPFWVRFVVDRDVEKRVTGLALASRARRLEIGAFLGPDDKAAFARDFEVALHRARN
jgi:uncharacterized membrane protein